MDLFTSILLAIHLMWFDVKYDDKPSVDYVPETIRCCQEMYHDGKGLIVKYDLFNIGYDLVTKDTLDRYWFRKYKVIVNF